MGDNWHRFGADHPSSFLISPPIRLVSQGSSSISSTSIGRQSEHQEFSLRSWPACTHLAVVLASSTATAIFHCRPSLWLSCSRFYENKKVLNMRRYSVFESQVHEPSRPANNPSFASSPCPSRHLQRVPLTTWTSTHPRSITWMIST